MKIVIAGVSGFLGNNLYRTLQAHGHTVVGWSRYRIPHINWQRFDYVDVKNDWDALLDGIELVINAVGIFQETKSQSFVQLHTAGPKKLFAECLVRNIKIIQISAIGADQDKPVTEFLRSKRCADQYLLEADAPNVVLYPGIVLGEGGRTTRQFSLIALLPVIPLVFKKTHNLPVVSVTQFCDYVAALIGQWPTKKQATVLIAQHESVESLFQGIRAWLKKGKSVIVGIPGGIFRGLFRVFPMLTLGVFNRQSLAMVRMLDVSQYPPAFRETATSGLQQHAPSSKYKYALRMQVLFYINLIVITFIWVISGLSSVLNLDESRELMRQLGQTGALADSVIYAGAFADIVLGVGVWLKRFRRVVLFAQLVVMAIYTVIITVALPIYWVHPFTPVVKNAALLVLVFYLLIQDKYIKE